MKKIFFLLLLVCLTLFSLAGCKKEAAPQEGSFVLTHTKELEPFGITGDVKLKQKPVRVATLCRAPVLILHELGVNQVLIPESRLDKWPEDLDKKAKKIKMAMDSNVSLETIIAAKPDLIIVPYQYKNKYGTILEEQKFPVYYVDTGNAMSYASVKSMTNAFIKAFDPKGEKGSKLQERFQKLEQKLSKVQAQNRNKKAMLLMSLPDKHFTQDKKGNLGSMVDLIGMTNVCADSKGATIPLNMEAFLSYKPDLIIAVGLGTAEEHKQFLQKEFKANEGYWNQYQAVREDRIIYLPAYFGISSGIGVVDNIEELIRRLEEFDKKFVK